MLNGPSGPSDVFLDPALMPTGGLHIYFMASAVGVASLCACVYYGLVGEYMVFQFLDERVALLDVLLDQSGLRCATVRRATKYCCSLTVTSAVVICALFVCVGRVVRLPCFVASVC